MTPKEAANTPLGKASDVEVEVYDGDKLETWAYYIDGKVIIVTFFNGKLDYFSK